MTNSFESEPTDSIFSGYLPETPDFATSEEPKQGVTRHTFKLDILKPIGPLGNKIVNDEVSLDKN